MIAYLNRFGSTPMGTFGQLVYSDFICYTLEREWKDNQSNISCIPAGQYDLEKVNSPKFGNVYGLIGDGVSLYDNASGDRWGILIHTANIQRELQGCIALGGALGNLGGDWAVTSSRNTVNDLYELLINDTEPKLVINWENI